MEATLTRAHGPWKVKGASGEYTHQEWQWDLSAMYSPTTTYRLAVTKPTGLQVGDVVRIAYVGGGSVIFPRSVTVIDGSGESVVYTRGES